MAARPDLLSSMSEMPTFAPAVQETERSVITRNPDGTISIAPKGSLGDFREVSHDVQPADWSENLADALDPNERMQIADKLSEFLEVDEQVRETHFIRMADAMELLGITDLPESDVPFEGASTVTHPIIAEACTQFQARAIEELFPPSGPVKPYIVGKVTEERQAQGDRLADYMNYQLTEEDEEYYWNTDQMCFYLPLSGSAFKKVRPDPITGMMTSRFVTAEDFIVPYHARSLRSAPRYAHRYEMSANDVRRAQEAGTFLADARLVESPNIGLNRARDNFGRGSVEDVADSREPNQHEDDVIYSMVEYHIDMHMPWDNEDEIAPPYIVTYEEESREVLDVRRNWKHKDKTKQKRIWFVQYKYLPGLGFYGFGLLHIIGSLAKAVSGGIRALLDSAAVANLQGGFRSKELKMSGELRLIPGQWQPVDATVEDLAKGFFNIPAKEPSTALATLVSTLVEEGRRFATITENMVGDADNRGPVGTTIALIEQGSKVFSGIHKRLHKSARQEFKLIATLNHEFMEVEEYPYEVQGEERTIMKSDFDGRVDIIPVSDPNIYSTTQRIALAQGTLELIATDPELYSRNQRIKAHRAMLQAMKVPNAEEIMPEPEEQRCDPVTENMDFLVGKGGKVFPEQDHQSHMMIHMNFAQHQAATNPELYKNIDPVIQAHIMEHQAYAYREEVEAQLGIKLPYIDLGEDAEREELPIEIEHMISQAVAARLKPPPPPPELQEEMDEAQQREDAKDLEAIGKLKRGLAEHAQKMQQADESHRSEERRKDESNRAEIRRADEKARSEIRMDQREGAVDLQQKKREGAVSIDLARKKAQASTFAGAKRKKKSSKK